MDIVILGLSVTSSWGNGHATTYRGLAGGLHRAGHRVTFLERNVPWYAANRDLPDPAFCRTFLYETLEELRDSFAATVRGADLVIVGSYVPEGCEVGRWVLETAGGIVAFYDIDTPVTLAKLRRGEHDYLDPELVARYPLYLSFAGGKALKILEDEFGSPMARPLYCAVDPELYGRATEETNYDLGYMGTYSPDRQPPLENLLVAPAREWPDGRFCVAGPQYPQTIQWPPNVERIEHLPPPRHRKFYNRQRFTLNITRADMIQVGHSPSVRLFEAAACATPVISDWWDGLETFFTPGKEIFISRSPQETVHYLRSISPEERQRAGEAARTRVMTAHTADHRARELEDYTAEAWRLQEKRRARPVRQRELFRTPTD